MQWIVNTLQEFWGVGTRYSVTTDAQPHEANFFKLDCSRARDLLQFQPVWTLEETLETIVNWYKAFNNGHDMRSEAKR